MAPRFENYSQGKLNVDLHRIARALRNDGLRTRARTRAYEDAVRLQQHDSDQPADRRLLELRALHSIVRATEALIDQEIVLARRREPVLTWGQIGDALGTTGQAVGQRARARDLAVTAPTEADVLRVVDEARAARGLSPLPRDVRPLPTVDKYDDLLHSPRIEPS